MKEGRTFRLFFLVSIMPFLAALGIVSRPSGAPPFYIEELQHISETTWQLPRLAEVELMNSTISEVLRACEVEFTGAFGDPVWGFVPGSDYPMIFVRDTSTLLWTAAHYYGDARLVTPIEEFLRRQYDEKSRSDEDGVLAGAGAISAVIAPDAHIDKATAVSDEEAHLIHAAYVYYETVGGVPWLSKAIRGRTVVDRLSDALEWLWSHRLDAQTGLIKRAHTTDWGDVKIEPASNPTDIDPERDHWTASLYDQALAYRALRELAEMNQAVGDGRRADELLGRAEELRRRAQEVLWQPERGFFCTHVHLTPLEHPFDEDEMVSIANAVAVRCGLADERQALSIFARLEQARVEAGARKPGVVLFPPYPEGTFAEARMAPGHYQNGALWDWWAGWQILAEFEMGRSDMARTHLLQVADEWAGHVGQVFEWQMIDDHSGFGPADYAGAAGTVGQSVLQGLFGVYVTHGGVTLQPRLASWEGFVRVHQPATGRYAAYRYTPRADNLYLDYGTSGPAPVDIAVLVPENHAVQQVYVDGVAIPHTLSARGDDVYCVIEAPTGIHRVRLAF